MSSPVVGADATSRDSFFDSKLGIYCFPIIGNIQRIREACSTISQIANKTFNSDLVQQKRYDFGKWIIGQIPAQILNELNPFIGIVDIALTTLAIALSIIEQIFISF